MEGSEDSAAHGHWCTFTDLYHTIPWVCYRRRNQWLRLALALFCLPLTWLARVVYLLVGVAEGCGGWRGHAYPTIPHPANSAAAAAGKGSQQCSMVWYGVDLVWYGSRAVFYRYRPLSASHTLAQVAAVVSPDPRAGLGRPICYYRRQHNRKRPHGGGRVSTLWRASFNWHQVRVRLPDFGEGEGGGSHLLTVTVTLLGHTNSVFFSPTSNTASPVSNRSASPTP